MNPPPKLKGNSNSELTKFKRLWRDDLSEHSRDKLRSLFVSSASNAQIREEIRIIHGIKLHRDDQLIHFREWELQQREMDLQAEKAAEIEHRLVEMHPDWTVDQVRDDLLKRMMQESWATGDYKLGLQTVDRHTKVMTATTDQRKFEFNAAKAAMEKLPELKAISHSSLTDDEKLEQARLALFGVAPQ